MIIRPNPLWIDYYIHFSVSDFLKLRFAKKPKPKRRYRNGL